MVVFFFVLVTALLFGIACAIWSHAIGISHNVMSARYTGNDTLQDIAAVMSDSGDMSDVPNKETELSE